MSRFRCSDVLRGNPSRSGGFERRVMSTVQVFNLQLRLFHPKRV
jgi:hypothetical protein